MMDDNSAKLLRNNSDEAGAGLALLMLITIL